MQQGPPPSTPPPVITTRKTPSQPQGRRGAVHANEEARAPPSSYHSLCLLS